MIFKSIKIPLLYLSLAIIVTVVNSGKVLVLDALSSQSHKNIFSPIVTGLAKKGHQITVVTCHKAKAEEANVRELVVVPGFDLFPNINTMRIRKEGIMGMVAAGSEHIYEACREVYNNPEFKKILNEQFDLVLIDIIMNECFYGVPAKLGSPLVLVSTLPAPDFFTSYLGNRLPASFIPDPMLPYRSQMTFFQRVTNVMVRPAMNFLWGMEIPNSEKLYREFLGQDTPGVDEILRNVSLLLMNSHFSINGARPVFPDIVEIGGGHCRPGKPLPKHVEEFISKGDGFIFFSLGSIVKPHELTDDIKNVFLNVFRTLKNYQIIWKWPEETMPGLPDNVKLLKWVPQQDVLAHPRIKLFMSHSGLLSIQEAVYHGVPIVGVPIFGDQDLNANLAAAEGFGEVVEILDVTEESLEKTMNKILKDDKYQKRAQELSVIFRDRNGGPVEDAVYWTEYIMRHKGALHLRSAARQLNFLQYYSIDVIAFLIAATALILYLIKLLVVKLFRKCCGKSSTEHNNAKKNN